MSEARERELRNYVTREGKTPFEDWVSALRDQRAKARLQGTTTVLLLCGGDKTTQRRDIETAHRYWKEFKSDAHEEVR